MMKRLLLSTLVISALFWGIPNDVNAQWNRTPTPNDTLKSVEVGASGEVTFRIYAPEAVKVTVTGDIGFENFRDLTKDETGVWSATTAPLKPGVYRYSFTVDGVNVNDPKSPLVQESRAMLEVHGEGSDFWAATEVPHGDVRMVWYPSTTTGSLRRMHIYTPPGYDNGSEPYPVLYLIHGGGDNDRAWTGVGRANFILDNLQSSGKINPMIVVMPNGSVPTDVFTQDLLRDIIPYVEKKYRVRTGSENRALAGLSMGGLEALDTGIPHNDLFAYIGVLSSGWFASNSEMMERAEKMIIAAKDSFNDNIRLFWITQGGKEDIAWENCQNMLKLFDRHGIKYVYSEKPGGHTWYTWRDNLYDLAPMLFK